MVTPHAGVRIEMFPVDLKGNAYMSPPTRGCELK